MHLCRNYIEITLTFLTCKYLTPKFCIRFQLITLPSIIVIICLDWKDFDNIEFLRPFLACCRDCNNIITQLSSVGLLMTNNSCIVIIKKKFWTENEQNFSIFEQREKNSVLQKYPVQINYTHFCRIRDGGVRGGAPVPPPRPQIIFIGRN